MIRGKSKRLGVHHLWMTSKRILHSCRKGAGTFNYPPPVAPTGGILAIAPAFTIIAHSLRLKIFETKDDHILFWEWDFEKDAFCEGTELANL